MNLTRSIDQLSYGDQGLKPKDDDQPNVGVGGHGANWEVANTMRLWGDRYSAPGAGAE